MAERTDNPKLERITAELIADKQAKLDVGDYVQMGTDVGVLVTEKQKQYGNSVGRSGEILKVLYPGGIVPNQFADALMVVRVLDKLSRIAQRSDDGKDLGGESPWKDIAGYGLLGWHKDEGFDYDSIHKHIGQQMSGRMEGLDVAIDGLAKQGITP
jgi:hypothetical protein